MHVEPSPVKGLHFHGEWKPGKKQQRLGRHKNPGLEIVLVSKGEVDWEVEGKQERVMADMLFYTLPWQEHGGVEELQPSSEISYLCIALDAPHTKPQRRFGFHAAFGFTTAEERAISSALAGDKPHALPATDEAVWLMSQFFKLAKESGPLAAARVRDTVKLLIADVACSAIAEHRQGASVPEAGRRVRRFAGVLAARHAEPWTMESMSRACGLGRTQFGLLMKKYTGDTPVTHLNRIRIREAQKLLRDTGKPVTEIAFEVGFNSSQYFATVFKEFTGVNAAGWREAEGLGRPYRAE